MTMPEFKDWFMGKRNNWEKGQPHGQHSDSAFARYLTVKQSSLSQWLAGSYLPDDENMEKIAGKLGDDAYDAAGRPRPDRKREKLLQMYDNTSTEKHDELIRLVEEIYKNLLLGNDRKR
jgi:transcriptional regulator with XRE-family HTH domain